jgi:hypothetical protein
MAAPWRGVGIGVPRAHEFGVVWACAEGKTQSRSVKRIVLGMIGSSHDLPKQINWCAKHSTYWIYVGIRDIFLLDRYHWKAHTCG